MRILDIGRTLFAVVMTMIILISSSSLVAMAQEKTPDLEKNKMTIRIGQRASVKVTNVPDSAKIKYLTSNKKVVTVSRNGRLTPKKTGKAVVKVTIKYKGKTKTLKCSIRVKQAIVAVIDGGAAKKQKVWKALKTTDAGARGPINGHAKRMIDVIRSEAPKAKILSIKVTDASDKYIDPLGVIKALKLAKKYKASVVYVSFYGSVPDEEEYKLISELIKSGVRVVGPAGNNHGADARKVAWLTNMKGADCVGAWGKGKILAKSNKHANLYIEAGSTSKAAARYAGMLANGKVYGVHKK